MEEITMFGIAAMPAIMVLCLLVGIASKNANFIDDRWIPVICGVFGLIFGIVGLYVMPNFPAKDVITAAAIGAVSGFASTGVHQVFKQFTKKDISADLEYYKNLAKDNEDSYLNVVKAYNEAQAELDLDDTFENFDLSEAE